ncbi:MAG: T9SS type A sorting domain-containing protein [Bacteroidetes bacterium]|nr:T9SS type A sorting domain-containing protein [Bacteroidota bacterium]
MKKHIYLFSVLFIAFLAYQRPLMAQAPTVQASNVQMSYKFSGTAVSISWTRGNGQNCMVVIRKNSSAGYVPSNNSTNYSASASYGSGSTVNGAVDNYVVYKGTGNAVYVYNLTPNTLYDCYVYEYNTLLGIYYYNSNYSVSTLQFNTLAALPATCSSLNSVTGISGSSATINFSAGSGYRFLTLAPASVSPGAPANGHYYASNVNYGSGALVGSAYAIYDGSGTTMTVSGLAGATTYQVNDFEYIPGSYSTSSSYDYNSRMYNSCDTYTFNTLNVAPTVNAISSVTVCQDAVQQVVSISGLSDGSTNETQNLSITASSGNTSLIPNPGISYVNPNSTASLYFTPAAGQYGTAVITVTVDDGWSVNNITTRTFSVTVKPKPSAAGAISGATTICAGVSTPNYSIAPTANTTGYVWTVPSGFTVTAGATTNQITVATASTTGNGQISVYPINTNGCGNGAASLFNITVNQQPAAPNAGPDQNIVCGTTGFLNATALSGGDAGTWTYIGSPAPAVSNPTVNSTSVTGLFGSTPNTYKFIWTVVRNGSVCPAKRDTMILIADFNNPACTPSANFSYGPTSDAGPTKVCVNSPVNFTDLSVSANSWNWDFNFTGTANYTSTLQNPVKTYTSVGTYSVQLKTHSNATGLDYIKTQVIQVIGAPATPGAIAGNTTGICAGNPNQFIYSVGAVTNATGYSWTVPSGVSIPSYPSATSIAALFGNHAQSGNITVIAGNSCGSSATSSLAVVVSPLPYSGGTTISGAATVCQGQNNVTYSISPISSAASYVWTDMNGVQTTTQNTFTMNIGANAAAHGQISVYGSNACGMGDTTLLQITVNPLPGSAYNASGQNNVELCPVPGSIKYTVNTINNASAYTWNLPSGVSVVGGNGADTIKVNYSSSTALGGHYIVVYGTNSCGNGIADSISVNVSGASAPQICMVSVDSTSANNIIFWDKTSYMHVDSFFVYREVSTNNYVKIGGQPYGVLSQFIDTVRTIGPANGNPNAGTYRYKLQLKDSCGNLSALSPYHNSIYFVNNAGSFTWNSYDVEGQALTPVTQFDLMRDDNSNGTWHVVTSVAGTQNILNDPQYGTYQSTASWRVEAQGFSCTPIAKPTSPMAQTYAKSKSNVKNNLGSVVTTVQKAELEKNIVLSPNPANDFLFVKSQYDIRKVSIYNVLGDIVFMQPGDSERNMSIDISTLSKAIYTIVIETPGGNLTRKIAKE